MRVLQLISSTGFYGAEGVVVALSAQLLALGSDVVVGVFTNDAQQNTELNSAAHRAGIPTWNLACDGRFNLAAVTRLVRYLRRRKIDVIHTHGYKANLYGLLAARLAGCRVIATCHNWTNRTRALRRYASFELRLLRHVDVVVAVSRNVADHLVQHRVPASRIQLIPNGIELSHFQHVQPKATTPLVIGALSRLSIEKGIDVLVRALPAILSRFPDLQCIVAGEGAEREQLLALAEVVGVSRSLTLSGFCADTPAFFASCNVIVHPSRIDGMPLSVIEAMAAGMPIVASAVGEIPSLLGHGSAGVLVPPGEPDPFAEAINSLLEDAAQRERLSQAARIRSQQFAARTMAGCYLELYRGAPATLATFAEATPAAHAESL